MINENILKGKWKEIKGEILTSWGDLNENELDKTKGNLTSILGLLEQRYGEKKEALEKKLETIITKFELKANDVGSKMTNATQDMKNRLTQKPAPSNVSPNQENSDHSHH